MRFVILAIIAGFLSVNCFGMNSQTSSYASKSWNIAKNAKLVFDEQNARCETLQKDNERLQLMVKDLTEKNKRKMTIPSITNHDLAKQDQEIIALKKELKNLRNKSYPIAHNWYQNYKNCLSQRSLVVGFAPIFAGFNIFGKVHYKRSLNDLD